MLFHVSYIRVEARIGIEPMHYSGCNRAPFRLGYRAMCEQEVLREIQPGAFAPAVLSSSKLDLGLNQG